MGYFQYEINNNSRRDCVSWSSTRRILYAFFIWDLTVFTEIFKVSAALLYFCPSMAQSSNTFLHCKGKFWTALLISSSWSSFGRFSLKGNFNTLSVMGSIFFDCLILLRQAFFTDFLTYRSIFRTSQFFRVNNEMKTSCTISSASARFAT